MDIETILVEIQALSALRAIRITDHARQAMENKAITLIEVQETIANAQIIENYPDHRRGSCCLLCEQLLRGDSCM